LTLVMDVTRRGGYGWEGARVENGLPWPLH